MSWVGVAFRDPTHMDQYIAKNLNLQNVGLHDNQTLRITPRGKIWLARKYLDYLDRDQAA
jgi:hypothetical protein